MRLFQAHSAFRCAVMGANARRCSRTQNGMFKRELPVKTLNIYILIYVTPCYYIILSRCTLCIYIEKGIPRLHDSVKYFDYFSVRLSCNSIYREHMERY